MNQSQEDCHEEVERKVKKLSSDPRHIHRQHPLCAYHLVLLWVDVMVNMGRCD